MSTQLTVCVLVCVFVCVQGFILSSPRWIQRHRLTANPTKVLQISKSDNFAGKLVEYSTADPLQIPYRFVFFVM